MFATPSSSRPIATAASGYGRRLLERRGAVHDRVVLKREIRDIERQTSGFSQRISTPTAARPLAAIPDELDRRHSQDLQSYFEPVDAADDESTTVAVADDVRSLIAFKRLNLMEPCRSADCSTPSSVAT